jgi:hypothetical protein
MAAAYYENGGPGGARNPTEFLRYLTSTYEDPNTQRSARGRLARLKQGDRESFAAFLPKFERELADSGGSTWPNDVKIDHLERCLNGELAELLYGQRGMPTEYLAYVRELQDLGANLDRKRYQAPKSKQGRNLSFDWQPTKQQKDKRNATPSGDTMDWEPTKISRVIQKQNKELRGKRAKWVDQEELDRRRKDGRCFRCGRTGCNVAECPLLPAKRPSQTARVQAKRTKPVLDAVVDEDDGVTDDSSYETETESEKE